MGFPHELAKNVIILSWLGVTVTTQAKSCSIASYLWQYIDYDYWLKYYKNSDNNFTNNPALTFLRKLAIAALQHVHQWSHQGQYTHREAYCLALLDLALQCFHFCHGSEWWRWPVCLAQGLLTVVLSGCSSHRYWESRLNKRRHVNTYTYVYIV